jgi:hypothetical protein
MPGALDKWGFAEGVRACEELGLIPGRLPLLEGASDAVVRVDGRELVNVAGIDLLGWQHDPGVLACFSQAVQRFGLVTGGSRVSQGVTLAHRELEGIVRASYAKESAISFASGLLANIGFIHAVSTRLALSESFEVDFSDTVFVFDRDCHWSLWKAAEKQAARDRVLAFRHNDPGDLRAILEGRPGDRVVVGFETVYSVDGSVAPIGEILDLCEEHGAVSYADDANGFMIYGPKRGPFARECIRPTAGCQIDVSPHSAPPRDRHGYGDSRPRVALVVGTVTPARTIASNRPIWSSSAATWPMPPAAARRSLTLRSLLMAPASCARSSRPDAVVRMVSCHCWYSAERCPVVSSGIASGSSRFVAT